MVSPAVELAEHLIYLARRHHFEGKDQFAEEVGRGIALAMEAFGWKDDEDLVILVRKITAEYRANRDG